MLPPRISMAKIEEKAEVHFYDFLYICIEYRGVGIN